MKVILSTVLQPELAGSLHVDNAGALGTIELHVDSHIDS